MRTLDFSQADAARERLLEQLGARASVLAKPPPDIEARKAAMRAAGARLFAQRGLAGASLADIAASLGLATTTCSYYYRTRDELIYAILHDHVMALHDALDAADPLPHWSEDEPVQVSPPLARLEALALALLQALASGEAAQRVLLAALHTLPVMSERTLRDLFRGVLWRIERVLLLAVPRLSRRRALLFPLAASFVAMAAHYVLWFRDDGRLSRAEYARLIVQMTVAGGKAAYRGQVGKARGLGRRQMPAGPLLNIDRERRDGPSPG